MVIPLRLHKIRSPPHLINFTFTTTLLFFSVAYATFTLFSTNSSNSTLHILHRQPYALYPHPNHRRHQTHHSFLCRSSHRSTRLVIESDTFIWQYQKVICIFPPCYTFLLQIISNTFTFNLLIYLHFLTFN